jgi:RNA polymerase sigma-70 factor (ECF subfamily)
MKKKMQGKEPVSNGAEKEIIGSCQEGNTESFGLLVRKYQNNMMAIAYRMMGNWDEAKDVTQDAFIKAYLSIKSFDKSTAFFHWLYRILVNQCMDQLRRKSIIKKIWRKIKNSSDESLNSPEQSLIIKERKAVIQKCLQELSHKQRACLILRDLQGFSCDEVAQILGCRPSTVRVHLFRGRENLKKIINQKKKEGKIDEVL